MRLVISRLIAILLLVVPGLAAAYGFLLMKDALYEYFVQLGDVQMQDPRFEWLSFAFGFILFFAGVGFIGGWIFFRDRKHKYVAPRFMPKRPRPTKPSGPDSGGTAE
ncbi:MULTISPECIES: DUF2627 domain-containing protein [Cohnella]|uniref:DUF2627 domain-containing protein n=1 Tax=Cohnella TaxID=329857 RepID=UPI0009BA0A5E|nr:DUF2627 domain-containing protein [Cohnella massiliensis]MBN2984407.1 DUF2627 domain-containing protein [Cohnella algarum]